MRLQADGRGLRDTTINERHATLADSLYAAERLARKETAERAKLSQTIRLAQAEKREEQIRKMAILAKAEKAKLMA
jgi:SNW domain-containing protein 1